MPDSKIPVEVSDLHVKRGGATIIEDASFSIAAGDYVGMVGPNGGGKSTLVQAMLGLIPSERGEIKLFGTPLDRFTEWDRLAYVSQTAMNFDHHFPMSVRELVALGLLGRGRIGRRHDAGDRENIEKAIRDMGIEDIADRRIGHISGGQKQRAFVARALVRNPDLLILDEPIAGVDADTQERFYKMLGNLNRNRGITIFIVSHDLSAVFCRMSRMMCVNRKVYISSIEDMEGQEDILKKVYGEHFHFVFHRHVCRGEFPE